VLSKLDSDDLTVHVIWTPVVPGDSYDAAVQAQAIVDDPRARHYWDADRSLGIAFKDFVTLPEGNDSLAWDIYFVYEPGTRWDGGPPVPADWWHQLAFNDRFLADGEGLRESLQDVVESSR